MICIISNQDGSDVVEEDEMKSSHSPYSTQPNYYYLFLHELYSNKKTQKLTLNIFVKSL